LILALVAFWGILFVYVANSALPHNTIRLPYQDRFLDQQLKMFLPEGFGFFTRNPKETRLLVYQIRNQTLIKLNQPNFSFDTFFGLRRRSRAINLELGLLLDQIGQDQWQDCEDSLNYCVFQTENRPAKFDNFNLSPFLCGELIIQKKDPVPWAWAKNFNREMPSQFLKLKIHCQ